MVTPIVAQADSTLLAIRKKVRRLVACPDQNSLTDNDLDTYINCFYSQDFPYGIKIDQMRSVYTFYTEPYRDRYPLDVNFNQGVRSPVYVDGIPGSFFKDRVQFYNLYPRFPTRFQEGGSSLNGNITGITQPAAPPVIQSANHNLIDGAVILIQNVVGMVQLNGNNYVITVVDANSFSLNGVNNTAYGAYVSGGTWTSVSQIFSFTLPGPFLTKECTLGGVDSFGNPITIHDDGDGNLLYVQPNPVVVVPATNSTVSPATSPPNPAFPGMYNANTLNPGLYNPTIIGAVDYVTGEFDFQLPNAISLATGTVLTIRISQYQTGLPFNLLFWNNEFHIRPIPKYVHKVEVETYLTPVQFMALTDSPILNQWWQYIAFGVACEISRDRQDVDGLQNLLEGFKRQEDLVLERQATEELFQPNITIFNSTQQNYVNGGWSQGGLY